MSSSVIESQISCSLLYPQTHLFPLPSKVSGSVCFVHNNDHQRTKLGLHALKSVFFEYSRTQKGYKCYCLELNSFIIFVDVTFFESKSYLNTEYHSSESDEYF